MAASKIDKAIAGLAEIIAKEASGEGIELDARVDAFKALTAYGLGLRKVKDKDKDDDENAPTFGNFSAKIKAVK